MSDKDVKTGRGKWIRTKIPAGELFEKKFRKTNLGCWEWQSAKDGFGYGAFRFSGKTVKAHRFSWEFYIGDIPNGLCVLHRCDNPGCVNPDHLFLGTRTDNAKDRDKKGRCASKEKHYCAKLSEEQVKTIRNMWINGMKGAEIAKLYGVDQSNISRIVNNKAWKGAAT